MCLRREAPLVLNTAGCAKHGTDPVREELPEEVRCRTRRGVRAGRLVRERKERDQLNKMRFKLCLPSVIMGNVRLLNSLKMYELEALATQHSEYKECNLLYSLTETWRHGQPESDTELTGFTAAKADRDSKLGRKKSAGGIILYVNIRGCGPGHVTVK